MLKILFVIDSLGPGGKERRLIELIKFFMSKQTISVEIVLMGNNVHYTELLSCGVNIHYLLRQKQNALATFIQFFKLARRVNPDIIHCWDVSSTFFAIPTSKVLNMKLINGVITDAPSTKDWFNKKRLKTKLSFPLSDLIISNSRAGINSYKSPRKKSKVIYNGFNNERLQILKCKESIRKQLNIHTRFVVGMVATFSNFKDYKTYFKAAQLLLKENSDVTFLAIGKNTDSPEANALIDKVFRSHFRLLGKKTDIESYINSFDVAVLSTFTEGISNSIMEYMALEKPVIATEGGGTSEIVENNVTGYLIPASSPDILAEKLKVLLEDTKTRVDFGKNGRKKIDEKFSIESVGLEYEMTCRDLIEKNKCLE